METPDKPRACPGCRDGAALDFAFSMAFQPIVDMRSRTVFAYEALVRGPEGQPAGDVLGRVTDRNIYAFDQRCRVRAIAAATAAGIVPTGAKLSINFLPNAVYSPAACIQETLKAAAANGFPTDRLIFEFTENEKMVDPAHVALIIAAYRKMGFASALDDFGAGHAGLSLLAQFQPDIIKLDMELIRGIDAAQPRRLIVDSIVKLCASLDITVIAEGVETLEELAVLEDLGITLVQGYLLARPAFEALPPVRFPSEAKDIAA